MKVKIVIVTLILGLPTLAALQFYEDAKNMTPKWEQKCSCHWATKYTQECDCKSVPVPDVWVVED